MNCNDILSQHQELQSIVFRVEHRGMQVEAVLSCLLPGGLAVEITAPQELAGLDAHCCHIPAPFAALQSGPYVTERVSTGPQENQAVLGTA